MANMFREVSLVTLITVLLCCISTIEATVNIETILGYHPREYKFNATKTLVFNGQRISCWDVVKVYSCWGRCDSFEYGDYKIPYKISYHPVCTYSGETKRKVRLRFCHPLFPEKYRYYEIFDASGCGCKLCDSENTSCEYLNG